ncbi:SDR family oxidoreductase [Paenibacillus cymbidii]|uniref:SDR family oxidoreductase n=1 Tax=Paenibacillus cymbidii TaxID=1639034 RepID=UPI00107FF45A|nr:SDR family oxidoreductase [Paenibacillus cymbidii]
MTTGTPTTAPKQTFPPQHQDRQPGLETAMHPAPQYESADYRPGMKLKGKTALITGGDSGIGRAAAIAFAKEGADVAIVYLNEHEDAEVVRKRVEALGVRCQLLAGDIGEQSFCNETIERTIGSFGKLDVLVNNAAEQHPQPKLTDITERQLVSTFRTNVFAIFYMTIAALPHLKRGASIINTASITAYRGNPTLIDYSATKGAIVSFTRALSQNVAGDGIRVNAVAPGPIWTPLIPSTFDEQAVSTFGGDTPMQRAGQPYELAAAYVYLASGDSSYMTGQTLHINGGEVVNG